MNRTLRLAFDYFLHMKEQVGREQAIAFTTLRYDVDRADLLVAEANYESPVLA